MGKLLGEVAPEISGKEQGVRRGWCPLGVRRGVSRDPAVLLGQPGGACALGPGARACCVPAGAVPGVPTCPFISPLLSGIQISRFWAAGWGSARAR